MAMGEAPERGEATPGPVGRGGGRGSPDTLGGRGQVEEEGVDDGAA